MNMSVALSTQDVPVWQPDTEVRNCNRCHREFNWWWRKHHCRRCGLVMCSDCSSQSTAYPPTTYVVSKPSQVFLASPVVPHRTCDGCLEQLRGSRRRGRGSRSGESANNNNNNSLSASSSPSSSSSSTTSTSPSIATSASSSSNRRSSRTDVRSLDSASWCPVCGKNMSALSTSNQERHIEACLAEHEFGSSVPASSNLASPPTHIEPEHNLHRSRMLVYTIPKPVLPPSTAGEEEPKSPSPDNDDSILTTITIPSLGECLICFEEFLPGDRVGRMECLCIYHESCIKGWFKKKGERICPVHT